MWVTNGVEYIMPHRISIANGVSICGFQFGFRFHNEFGEFERVEFVKFRERAGFMSNKTCHTFKKHSFF